MKIIQVANTVTGDYDPRQHKPFPFGIEADGSVTQQEFWKGEPARLIGFQRDAHVQQVDLLAEDWLASDDPAPEGWHPVFADANGSFWSHAYPVQKRGEEK